jgi:hypothetical protein
VGPEDAMIIHWRFGGYPGIGGWWRIIRWVKRAVRTGARMSHLIDDETVAKMGHPELGLVKEDTVMAKGRVQLLSAVGGGDHDGVGVDLGDAEVAAEMDEIERT